MDTKLLLLFAKLGKNIQHTHKFITFIFWYINYFISFDPLTVQNRQYVGFNLFTIAVAIIHVVVEMFNKYSFGSSKCLSFIGSFLFTCACRL